MEEKKNDILDDIIERNVLVSNKIEEIIDNTYTGRISRALNAGAAMFLEYLLYAVGLLVIVFVFIMNNVTPFHILQTIKENDSLRVILERHEINNFLLVIKGIIIFCGSLLIMLGYVLRRNRKFKSSIHENLRALKDVSTLLAENKEQYEQLTEASNKLLEAANHIAHETKLQ